MPIEHLIQAGLIAIKAGDHDNAAKLFAQAVNADPSSEQGWLLLGKCVLSPDQKKYCFERVLRLNPNNQEALLSLKGAIPPGTTSPQKIVLPVENPANSPLSSFSQPVSAMHPRPAVTPFFIDNDNEEELLNAGDVGLKPGLVHPAAPILLENKDKVLSAKRLVPSRREKKNPARTIFLWSIPVFLICLVGIGYLVLSDSWMKLLPSALFPLPLPTSAVGVGSLRPSDTLTYRQFPTVTPTIVEPTVIPSPVPTIVYSPTFSSEQCKFDHPKGVTVSCGYLTVPEDRTDPKSPNIQIAVAVFHSTSANPAPDPVIFLQGGPGGEAIMTSVGAFDILVSPFLEKRDYIAFDQRGTGLTKPAINCPELETVSKQDMFGQIPASSRNMIYTNAFRSCHGMLTVSGIGLNDFNTVASSDDLKDLVTALGYTQVDLYAASYGTRLALVTMRNHPEILRSVVLDSVVPVEARLYYEDPARYNSSLQALFDGCAADPKCKATYPNLESDFWNLVAQLDAHPVSVTAPLLTGGKITETVTGSDLLGVVTLGLLKWAWMIPTAPMSLDQIKSGDYSTFVAMQSSLPDEYKGINIGVYISMMCHEHILAGTPEELQAVLDSQKDIVNNYQWIFFGDAEDIFNTCKVWDSTPPASGENNPVVSDIPTLIFEGAYDPVTPPAYGKEVARNLSHSYYVEFPNQGHTSLFGDTTGCASSLVQAFFDDPGREPDRSCVATLPSINFLTPYTGNPPVKLEVSEGFGLKAKMPVEWEKIFDGFYLRNNSSLDITQLVVIRTFFFDTTSLLDSLSSKLYGYNGFDAAPILVGTRKANGLDWSLYETTSYGRPVELAMADSAQGDAVVVLLFCHKDELDALVQTVYLPVIDSVVPSQ